MKALFRRFDCDNKGSIDLLDWIEYLTPEDLYGDGDGDGDGDGNGRVMG